jgi:hypothetical protein
MLAFPVSPSGYRSLASEFGMVGIRLQTGYISFSAGNCTVNVEAATIAANGEVATREAEAFKRNAHFYGLKPEHLNQTFVDLRGARFKLVGLNVKARTRPFLVEDVSGRSFVAEEAMVLRGFGIEPRTRFSP